MVIHRKSEVRILIARCEKKIYVYNYFYDFQKKEATMNKKFRILSIIFVLLFLVVSVNAAQFVGSKKSNKYHYPTCKWAQKINPSNLVKFNSPEEAIKAGYSPCKICKPPISSKAQTNEIKFVSAKTNNKEQRRGCCSWHKGVCGCSGGRAVCCDGTLSPSCGCD